MSATEMMAQNSEMFDDTHMDPELEMELFGSVEDSDTSTTSPASSNTTAPSPSSQATSAASEVIDEAKDAELAQRCFAEGAVTGTTNPSKLVKSSVQLDREEEKRIKLERREMALQKLEDAKKGPSSTATNVDAGAPKRKRGDDDVVEEKAAKRELTDDVAAEMRKPEPASVRMIAPKRKPAGEGASKPTAVRVENTAAAITEAQKQLPTPATDSAPKRKREEEDAVEADAAKSAVAPIADAGTLKKRLSLGEYTARNRKRSTDDEQEERSAKRGLTDAAAAEIAQQSEHHYSADLEKEEKRRDSVTDVDVEGTGVDDDGKEQKGGETAEQHLAPSAKTEVPKTATSDLTITEDDDEMTRMLKEELAKPFVDEPVDDESELEDPRVEEIMQPLFENEKLLVAKKFNEKCEEIGRLLGADMLEKAVKVALERRERLAKKQSLQAARAVHAPKKTSPLANDGVKADVGSEEQGEIEARPKLAPKSRKAAAKVDHNDTAVPTVTSSATTPTNTVDTTKAPSASTTPPPASPAQAQPEYTDMKLENLKKLCRDRGLVVGGNKKVIVQRLVEYDADHAAGRVPKGLKALPKAKKGREYPWVAKKGRKGN